MIPRDEYDQHGLLAPSEATRSAVSDEELEANLLSDAEFDAIIEREQREAVEWAAQQKGGQLMRATLGEWTSSPASNQNRARGWSTVLTPPR